MNKKLSYEFGDNQALASITFDMDDLFLNMETPVISSRLIGVIPYAEQGIADENGNPLIVDWDFDKKQRKANHPTVGPLRDLNNGLNIISIVSPGTFYTPSKKFFVPSFNNEDF